MFSGSSGIFVTDHVERSLPRVSLGLVSKLGERELPFNSGKVFVVTDFCAVSSHLVPGVASSSSVKLYGSTGPKLVALNRCFCVSSGILGGSAGRDDV